MSVEKVHIDEFLSLGKLYPMLDVRSPGEFNHAHIPGACNLPLFTDEERKVVGTAYKQQNREAAIKIGLDYFGPKMRKMVEEVENICANSQSATGKKENGQLPTSNRILVHCWRGGMRSAAVAWLLDLYGFQVYTLIGGYKKYRGYIVETFEYPYRFKILGGYTGSGKTLVLRELETQGEAIVDLENIACHKGSAFGAIGQPSQPSQEMFENLLAQELRQKGISDYAGELTSKHIWLEDESQRIGLVNIPQLLWNRMRQSPVYFIDIPFEERLGYVLDCYGNLDTERMVDAMMRIRKRLGGLETKTAINFLVEGNTRECFRVLLRYYDKYYTKGLLSRQQIEIILNKISLERVDAKKTARQLLAYQLSLTATNSFAND